MTDHVVLRWSDDELIGFSRLLQAGFTVEVHVGKTVRDVLCRQLGIADDYLDRRIGSVFLDGKPVDEVDCALVRESSVLALSGPMPGFVGAAMRKGGAYAAMRREITHVESSEPIAEKTGRIMVRLYNVTIDELGPIFLRRGIWLTAGGLGEFLATASRGFWARCLAVEIDCVSVSKEAAAEALAWGREGPVRLKVITAG